MNGSEPKQGLSVATAQAAVDRLVRESQFSEAVIASLPGIFYCFDDSGRYLRWNRNLEELTGYSHAEIAEMHPLNFFEGAEKAIVEQRIGEVFATGRSSVEARLVGKDGSSRPFYFTGHRLESEGRHYLVGMGLDLSALKRAQDAVRTSEERFRQLAENITEVFWVAELRERRLQYASPAYEAVWGRSDVLASEPGGWLDLVHADDRGEVESALAQLAETNRYELEYRIVRPDGAVRWIRDRASTVRNPGGQVERVVGVAEDVTERRKLEEQFLHAQRMEAVGQLSGGVAHDFNNILTAILGHASMIQARVALSPADAASLQEITRAAERAADLTRQLLTFSRKQVMALRDVELSEVLRRLTKMIRPIVGEHIRMQLGYSARPLWIHADSGMIEQVVLNLVVNARDAMPNGGCLELTTEAIDLDEATAAAQAGARAGAFLRLTVRDTGHGISAEHMDRIFEPFFTTKDVGAGTGLGLSTAYGIVHQHQGWIAVESEVGRGTAFHVHLPRLEGPRETPLVRDALRNSGNGGGETILFVEDEAMVSFIVRSVLAEKGYRILSATSGKEALTIWSANRERIDLLLTDVVMPDGISGRELASRVRADRPALPVLFTSGYDPQTAGETLRRVKGTAFIAKPFTVDALCHAVAELLARR